VRTVGVRLTADVSSYVSSIKRAGVATTDLKTGLSKAATSGHLDTITDQATKLGVAGVAAFGLIVKSAADFDKQMSAVSAATHASGADMDRLRAAALQAGKDTQFSATQAAEGITELSKAGRSTSEILGGGLKGALDLAAAGQISVGEAAETASSAMTQFKLSGTQVPHVADLLAAAAGKAQGSVHDMGAALNQSGLVARQFGLSIEDTTGVLAEFASAGLRGSDAGTSLKTMLLAIANPSQQSRDLMKQLGISFYDAQGRFVGLSGVAQVLQTRLTGLTDAQRQQALGQIFGNDAIRAAGALYSDGAKGVDRWKNAVNEAGYASETATKLTDNLSGDLERLKSSLETMAIESGSGANSGLRSLAQMLNQLVGRFSELPPVVSSTLTVMAGIGGALLLGTAAWIKYRKVVGDAKTELEAMGPAGERASAGIGKFNSMLGRAGAVIAGFQVASSVAAATLGSNLNPKVEALGNSLSDFAATGRVSGEAARLFGGDLGRLDMSMKDVADTGRWSSFARGFAGTIESITGTGAVFDDSLLHSKERLQALDQSLQALVSGGHAQDAAQLFDLIAQRAAKQGVSVNELRNVLPGYAAMVDNVGSTAQGTAGQIGGLNSALQAGEGAQKSYASEADAAAAAARGERNAIADLSTKLKAQTDPVFGLLDAQMGLKKAQDAAAEATRKHGRNSDQAKEATRQLALAAIELQGKAGALAGTFNGKMTPAMYQTLRAAGLTEKQINDVSGQFRQAKKDGDKYARKYSANVSLTGAPAVAHKLQGLSQIQQALAKGVKIPINPTTFFHGLASGGPVSGPGTGTSDSIPAMLSDGEFVVRAASVDKIGADRLDHMNRTGEMPAFAGGGRVGWPYPTTAAMTRIPSRAEVENAVTPAGPSGGRTSDWIVRVVHAAFPGLAVLSKDRPGSRTLTGNTSYHALGRAVDFSPSHALAVWWNQHYKARTKELITPWQSLNIHNGARHAYSPLIYRQHNFAGGNAHDHIAMAGGGVIREPVFGVGASGDTYSFGEGWRPETVTPGVGPGGAPVVHVGAPVININGANQSPKQIALAVNRELGSLVDYYSRGN
jgi:TP901 family phage tail tape measure protein